MGESAFGHAGMGVPDFRLMNMNTCIHTPCLAYTFLAGSVVERARASTFLKSSPVAFRSGGEECDGGF